MISMKKTVMGAALAMAFGAGGAQAMGVPTVTTYGNNFTMVSSGNGLSGGTNDVVFSWDGTLRSSVVSDGSYNATLSSVSPFSGNLWTAKNVNLYGAGTYTFHTDCVAGDATAACATTSNLDGKNPDTSYTVTVAKGQVLAHMLFDWNGTANIDVVNLWKVNNLANTPAVEVGTSWGDTGTTSPMQLGSKFAGAGAPATTTTATTLNTTTKTVIQKKWGNDSAYPGAITTSTLIKSTGVTTIQTLAGGCVENNSSMTTLGMNSGCYLNNASTKWDGVSLDLDDNLATLLVTEGDPDNQAGIRFVDGPFINTNAANFNVNGIVAPIPAAAWLLGSGLLGLVGVARRKQAA